MLKTYAVCLITFLLCDAVWIGLVALSFYKRHLGHLFTPKPFWAAAVLFYLIYVGGVVRFVVIPSAETHSLKHLLVSAAVFGICTFGAYDLTNWATLRDWPAVVVVVDMAWGVIVTSAISTAGYFFVVR